MTSARAIPADRLARRLAAAGALAAALAGPALAQDAPAFAPDAALLQQVETMARSGAAAASRGEGQAAAPAVRVEVKVGQLDPRLRLAPCQKIEPYLPPGLPAWGSTRMGLRCTQGPKHWNVSLPVHIGVFTRATVLKDNLPAGTVLDASQLMQAEVDIASAPGTPVIDPAAVLGRTLARNLASGTTLRTNDLKAKQFFSAGEPVRVIAVGNGWNVSTEAQAVSAGVEGRMARVRTDSGRILVARPSGDHQVEVVL